MVKTCVPILVVEDIPQVRATAVSILARFGCKVFEAYNGLQALAILEAHPEIKVVFADVRMPGMDGLQLADTAQRLRPDLRIVLTSGYIGKKDVPDGTPFVTKPWREEEMISVVLPDAA